MRLMTTLGMVDAAYLNGAEVAPELEGVRYRIEVRDGALTCTGSHPEDEGHMVQYGPDQRRRWQELAARAAGQGPLAATSGEEAWIDERD